MVLPGTEPRRWVLGRWISFPRRLDNKSPYKNLRSNFTFGLVEGFKFGIGGMLGSEKNSLALHEGMFYATVNFLFFRSRKLHSAAGTREVSHSHNRIHREFSIMFQLTSIRKHDAITRDHSVQMKRHFLVQPQRYPFPKLACSVGRSSGDMAVQFTLPLPIRVGWSVGRSQEGGRTLPSPSIDPRDINHYDQILNAKSICTVH